MEAFFLLSVDVDPEVADRPGRPNLVAVGLDEPHGYRLGVVGKGTQVFATEDEYQPVPANDDEPFEKLSEIVIAYPHIIGEVAERLHHLARPCLLQLALNLADSPFIGLAILILEGVFQLRSQLFLVGFELLDEQGDDAH